MLQSLNNSDIGLEVWFAREAVMGTVGPRLLQLTWPVTNVSASWLCGYVIEWVSLIAVGGMIATVNRATSGGDVRQVHLVAMIRHHVAKSMSHTASYAVTMLKTAMILIHLWVRY